MVATAYYVRMWLMLKIMKELIRLYTMKYFIGVYFQIK